MGEAFLIGPLPAALPPLVVILPGTGLGREETPMVVETLASS